MSSNDLDQSPGQKFVAVFQLQIKMYIMWRLSIRMVFSCASCDYLQQ